MKKKILLTALTAMLLMVLSPAAAFAAGIISGYETTGITAFDDFINDSEYCAGTYWDLGQHPKISASGSSGCASYCADFVKYCYGIDALTSRDVFYDPDQIRAGDVIHLTSANSGHWFVVLRREGNELLTAEGNWADRVRIGWNYEITEDDVIGSRHSFDCGYHFLPVAEDGFWEKTDEGWTYLYRENCRAVSTWIRYSGKWYFLDETGIMAKGWRLIEGKWYYFTGGAMQTGWKKLSGKWYYFNKNGSMVKGWRMIDGKWYYFAGGAMVTGWRRLGGTWYFFSGGGVMQTGWKQFRDKMYYLDDGAMVTGTQVIDGVEYIFDEEGALISESAAETG